MAATTFLCQAARHDVPQRKIWPDKERNTICRFPFLYLTEVGRAWLCRDFLGRAVAEDVNEGKAAGNKDSLTRNMSFSIPLPRGGGCGWLPRRPPLDGR